MLIYQGKIIDPEVKSLWNPFMYKKSCAIISERNKC